MGTVILRIGIIILGVFLLSVTFSNYVRGKLREKATFLWGILAIAMILSGAVPVLSGWSKRFNDEKENLICNKHAWKSRCGDGDDGTYE